MTFDVIKKYIRQLTFLIGSAPMVSLTSIKKFRQFIGQKVWNYLLLALIIGFLWFCADLIFVFVIQSFLVGLGLVEFSKTMLPEWFPQSLIFTTFAFVGFGVFRAIIYMLRNYFTGMISQAFLSHQREKILRYGLLNSQKEKTSEIIVVFNDYIQSTATTLQGILQFSILGTSIFLYAMMAANLALKEFSIAMSIFLLLFFPLRYFDSKLKNMSDEIVLQKEEISRILFEGLKNNFLLKIYGILNTEINKGTQAAHHIENIHHRYYVIAAIRVGMPLIVGSFVVSLVSYLGVSTFHTTGAALLSFFYMLLRFLQGSSEFVSIAGELRVQMAGMKRLYNWNLRAEKHLVEFQVENVQHKEVTGNIAIKLVNLFFKYDEVEVLKNLNLNINPNEILLIKGPSGAGKSTLVSLILGLMKPTSGQVLINDSNAFQASKSLAEKVAYVGPDPYLIPGTIKENLIYGHPNSGLLNDQDLWEVLTRAQIDDHVRNFPLQLNEYLYEVTQMSTGQKQRLAIARALLRSPKLLILDEATANLDSQTEEKFIQTLSQLKQRSTMIIISHKNGFDQIADHTILMQKVKNEQSAET